MTSTADAVAVITDIHANLPALEAALARIDELGIEQIYCGGDLVGYGPHPNEVCALIAEREIPTIYGNYDYAIGRDLDDCGCAYITPEDRELGQRSVAWTLDNTVQASKDFMRELPFELHFPVGEHRRASRARLAAQGQRVPLRGQARAACTSGSPAAETDQVLVFGHTHKPWVHEYGGVLFVNCGSVGKPKDGDPRGAFAILRATASGVEVTIERVRYDAEAVAARSRPPGCRPSTPTSSLAAA